MVTQSVEVSLLSFALPSTAMALIHTFANNSGREQWQVVQGATPPLTIFERGNPPQQITYHWKGNLSDSPAHFQY